jgi:hypothetical protein
MTFFIAPQQLFRVKMPLTSFIVRITDGPDNSTPRGLARLNKIEHHPPRDSVAHFVAAPVGVQSALHTEPRPISNEAGAPIAVTLFCSTNDQEHCMSHQIFIGSAIGGAAGANFTRGCRAARFAIEWTCSSFWITGATMISGTRSNSPTVRLNSLTRMPTS